MRADNSGTSTGHRVGVIPKMMRPLGWASWARISSPVRSTSRRMRSAFSSSFCPASVSRTPRLARVNSATPSSSSRRWTCRVSAGWASRSVLSAPMNVAGQIAARTKRIKIGTAVHVLPLAHPLRLAEETATVDVVSRGRFILGAGRSGNPRSYRAYGVPYEESRERFFETLEILKKAWTEDTFSYDGQYHSFNEARAVPRPYQRPHPPIRIAGASEDTFPTLGRLGYPLFVSVRSGS